MKLSLKLRTMGLLTGLALGSLAMGCQGPAKGPSSIRNIDGAELATVVREEPDALLLDVRTPEEYAAEKVRGARHINVLDDSFQERVSQAYPDKEAPIYIYCKSGSRSMKAATLLEDMGYTHIFNVTGGIGGIDPSIKTKP